MFVVNTNTLSFVSYNSSRATITTTTGGTSTIVAWLLHGGCFHFFPHVFFVLFKSHSTEMTSCARPAQTADAPKQIKRSEPSSEAEKERQIGRVRERGRASDLQPMGSIWFPVHNIANRTFVLRCCVPLAAFTFGFEKEQNEFGSN